MVRAQRLWAQVDLGNLDGSWSAGVGRRMFGLVASGQALAADGADRYLDEVLTELDVDTASTASVKPEAFAGVASDGRALASLLYAPIARTKAAVASKSSQPMQTGEASLVRIVATQLLDTSRASVAAGIAARPKVTGYARMLNEPACGRCAVLAGDTHRWNGGFASHPHCSCRHIPTTKRIAGDLTTDPRTYFDGLTEQQQARYFGDAGAAAIRDGAAIGTIINVRRDMAIAGAAKAPRLMPARLIAKTRSHADAVDALKAHGYLG